MVVLDASGDLPRGSLAGQLAEHRVGTAALLEGHHGREVVADGQDAAAVSRHGAGGPPEAQQRRPALEDVDRGREEKGAADHQLPP
eukprot:6544113-Pyramimonas_sp.AAC.1